jgi:hypothetical protein
MQRLRLDLLPLQLGTSVVEVEYHSALLQLLDEQVVSLLRPDVCG